MNLIELFTLIANAIRGKKGTDEKINATDFPTEIENLSTGVKHFLSTEELHASTDNKVGDLAIIYDSKIEKSTANSRFSKALCPSTVVLNTAVTSYIDLMYRATSDTAMFDGWGNISKNEFRFEGFSDNGMVRIEYTSSDGITYKRTDGGSEIVDFGTEIYFAYPDSWNDAIGEFIRVPSINFEGLFEYIDTYVNKDYVQPLAVSSITYEWDGYSVMNATAGQIDKAYKISDLVNVVAKMGFVGLNKFRVLSFAVDTDDNMYFIDFNGDRNSGYSPDIAVLYDNNGNFVDYLCNETFDINIYQIAENFSSATLKYTITPEPQIANMVFPIKFPFTLKSLNVNIRYSEDKSYSSGLLECPWSVYRVNNDGEYASNIIASNTNVFKIESRYVLAPTQFNANKEYVYGQTFYGVNGVETGTLNQVDAADPKEVKSKVNVWDSLGTITVSGTNMFEMLMEYKGSQLPTLIFQDDVESFSWAFAQCSNLTSVPTVPTSNCKDFSGMYAYDSGLTSVPILNTAKGEDFDGMYMSCAKITTLPTMDLSNATNISRMCYSAKSLVNFPYMAIPKVNSMTNIFTGCTNLSDESLNNILAMCISATAYIAQGTQLTLYRIGLTSAQATKCQSLSNYSAFINAGWKTGY